MGSAAQRSLRGLLGSLTALHLYWRAGGRHGFDAASPRTNDGRRLFEPGTPACVVVAVVLMIGAVLAVMSFDPWLKSMSLRLMAVIFALRAVGDFRYVGFFKRTSDSTFAYWDTRLYAPLCVTIATLAVIASAG